MYTYSHYVYSTYSHVCCLMELCELFFVIYIQSKFQEPICDRRSWLDCIIDSMDMTLSKLHEAVKNKKPWCAVVHGVAKSRT